MTQVPGRYKTNHIVAEPDLPFKIWQPVYDSGNREGREMKYQIILTVAVCTAVAGCDGTREGKWDALRTQENRTPRDSGIVRTLSADGRIGIYTDTARGVVCYTRGRVSISCLPIPTPRPPRP